jgi:hypothetical protein
MQLIPWPERRSVAICHSPKARHVGFENHRAIGFGDRLIGYFYLLAGVSDYLARADFLSAPDFGFAVYLYLAAHDRRLGGAPAVAEARYLEESL